MAHASLSGNPGRFQVVTTDVQVACAGLMGAQAQQNRKHCGNGLGKQGKQGKQGRLAGIETSQIAPGSGNS